jgi:hypothetical protein
VDDTDSEPNNDFPEATNLTGNVSISGTISFTDPGDYYRIMLWNGTNPNLLNASIEFTTSGPSASAYMSILDPLEFRLDQVLSSGEPANVSTAAIYGDYYYLAIIWNSLNENSVTISYTMNVTLGNITFTPDGNNGPADAPALSDGLEVSDSLDEVTDASDLYKAHLNIENKSKDLLMLILQVPVTGDFDVDIYDGNLKYIRTEGEHGMGIDEIIYFPPPIGNPIIEDYYFRIWASDGFGSYSFSTTVWTAWKDNDNNYSTARVLQPGVEMAGNISDDYDDSDYYMVNLTKGAEITVDLYTQSYNTSLGMPDFNLYLLNTTYSERNSSLDGDPHESVWYEAKESGWHFVWVNVSSKSFGNYLVNTTVLFPPVIKSHNNTVTIPEDETGELNLTKVFEDPDGGTLAYAYSGNSTIAVSVSGDIASFSSLVKDWHGTEVVTFTATNDLDKSASTDITVKFVPVNDAPEVKIPELNFTTDEDVPYEFYTSFLNAIFVDVDGDDLEYNFTNMTYMNVTMGNESVVFTPEENWYGDETLILVASDPVGETAECQIYFEVDPVDDDPVALPMAPVEIAEDKDLVVDLSAYFSDPDGDELTYDGYSLGDHIGRIHIFVDTNGTNATVTLEPDWYGTEDVSFVAKDPTGLMATSTLTVTVIQVNDAPVVDNKQLTQFKDEFFVWEDDQDTFDLTILFRDPDGDPITFDFTGGDALQITLMDSNLTIKPPANWNGDVPMVISAKDPYGLSTSVNLTLRILSENDQPVLTGGQVSPESGDKDTEFVFTVIYSDIDGDEPTVYTVIDGKSYVMTFVDGDYTGGATYQYKTKLKPGKHKFSFLADDGARSSTSTAVLAGDNIEISEPFDSSLYLYIFLIIIFLVIVFGIAIKMAKERSERIREYEEEMSKDDEDFEEERMKTGKGDIDELGEEE